MGDEKDEAGQGKEKDREMRRGNVQQLGLSIEDAIVGMRRFGELFRSSGAEEMRNLEKNLHQLRKEVADLRRGEIMLNIYEVLGTEGDGSIRIRGMIETRCSDGRIERSLGIRAVEARLSLINDHIPDWATVDVRDREIRTKFTVKEVVHTEIVAKIATIQEGFSKFMDCLEQFGELRRFWEKEKKRE